MTRGWEIGSVVGILGPGRRFVPGVVVTRVEGDAVQVEWGEQYTWTGIDNVIASSDPRVRQVACSHCRAHAGAECVPTSADRFWMMGYAHDARLEAVLRGQS